MSNRSDFGNPGLKNSFRVQLFSEERDVSNANDDVL